MLRGEKKKKEKEKKDVTGAKYIKDERGVIKIKEEEILVRWKLYFEDLSNKENEHILEGLNMVEGPVSKEEIKKALKN